MPLPSNAQLFELDDSTLTFQGLLPIRPDAIRPAGEWGPGGFTVTRMWPVVGAGSAFWLVREGAPETAAAATATAPASRPARLRFLIFRPVSMAASTGAAPGSTAANAVVRSSCRSLTGVPPP